MLLCSENFKFPVCTFQTHIILMYKTRATLKISLKYNLAERLYKNKYFHASLNFLSGRHLSLRITMNELVAILM